MQKNTLKQFLSKNKKFNSQNFAAGFSDIINSPQEFAAFDDVTKENIAQLAIFTEYANPELTSLIARFVAKLSKDENAIKSIAKTDSNLLESLSMMACSLLTKCDEQERISCARSFCAIIKKNEQLIEGFSPKIINTCIKKMKNTKLSTEEVNAYVALLSALFTDKKTPRDINALFENLTEKMNESKSPCFCLHALRLFAKAKIAIAEDTIPQEHVIEDFPKVMKNLENSSIIFINCSEIIDPTDIHHKCSWIAIGDEIIIALEEKPIVIPPENVVGMDTSGTNMSVIFDSDIEELHVKEEQKIIVSLDQQFSQAEWENIINRVKGECDSSQEEEFEPQTQESDSMPISQYDDEKTAEHIEESPIDKNIEESLNDKKTEELPKKNPKSSIALFIPQSYQKKEQQQNDGLDQLFTNDDSSEAEDQKEETKESESDDPPMAFYSQVLEDVEDNNEEKQENADNNSSQEESPNATDVEVIDSATPQEHEEQEQTINESELSSPNIDKPKNVEEEAPVVSVVNSFGDAPFRVSHSLKSGMDILTQNQLSKVETFNEKLQQRVVEFKEKLTALTKQREDGSIKKIEAEKSAFNANIQLYKRRESAIQSSLAGYESCTKEISEKLSSLQKAMKKEVRMHKKELENEISQLRKMIGNKISDDEDDDSPFSEF